MGSAHGYADMPEPIGRTYVLAVPGADIEKNSSLLPVRNMQKGKGTAYFPVAVSKMWAEGRFPFKGFVTPAVFSDPESVFNEMDDMGFNYKLDKIADGRLSKRIS